MIEESASGLAILPLVIAENARIAKIGRFSKIVNFKADLSS
jgi:hypothetical protein